MCNFRLLVFIALSLLIEAKSDAVAIAQILADTTLDSESSTVNRVINNGTLIYGIEGGATRGSNLFHSFNQFSLNSGDAAVFLNPATIKNIITRVTGSNVSNLNGFIQANGDANLFLINPKGIIIGPHAKLDIGGSFVASTGQGLRFANNFLYQTDSTEIPPLLTINAPIGIVMDHAPGSISVIGTGAINQSGLAVSPGKTMALLGGEISLIGAKLSAPGGHIELGSIKGSDQLSLTSIGQQVDVGFSDISSFGDIRIQDQSRIDTSSIAGGAIEIRGRYINLTNQSSLVSDTLGDLNGRNIQIIADRFGLEDGSFIGAATLGSGNGGNIRILTRESIDLIGIDISNFKLNQFIILVGLRQIDNRKNGGIFAGTTASGDAGDITLATQNLVIDKGAFVSTESFGTGKSGDINITATESITVNGSGIATNSQVYGVPLVDLRGAATGLSRIGIPAGAAGNVNLSTKRLVLDNGAVIAASTVTDASSGNIFIQATDSIKLQGFFDAFPIPTAISTTSVGGNGKAGDVVIETNSLTLQDGSKIFTSSGSFAFAGAIPFGGQAGQIRIDANKNIDIIGTTSVSSFTTGVVASSLETETLSMFPAGNIYVTTPQLMLRDGGKITSSTLGSGQGGDIEIKADLISLSGVSILSNNLSSGIFSNSSNSPEALKLTTTDGVGLPTTVLGDGGTIRIQAKTLLVQNGATISVGGFSLGNAGNIEILGNKVQLNNKGSLIATTASGRGGNISLNVEKILQLRHQSQISATASNVGDGGRISFQGGFIVAVPDENSDIIANAVSGQGGRVTLSAQRILGMTPRNDLTVAELRGNTSSDISASSETGIDGSINLEIPSSDPLGNLAGLPTNLIDGSTLIEPTLCAAGNKSKFLITGRGGLPTAPTDTLSVLPLWDGQDPQEMASVETPELVLSMSSPIRVEAQNWMLNSEGKIVLYADLPTPLQSQLLREIAQRSPHCRQLGQKVTERDTEA